MKRLLLIGFIYILLQSISCKKSEHVDPDSPTPVFSVNGNINGSYVNIQAGVDEYYMYSSNKRDSITNLNSYIGTFKQVNCSSCNNQFSIKINDLNPTAAITSSHIDSLLNGGLHYHYDSASTVTYILFSSESSPYLKPVSFFWDFGDGSTSKLENPSHVYYGTGSFTACNTVTYSNGCSATSCNEVKADFNDCYAFIAYRFSNDTCYFTGNATGNSISGPLDFEWKFGDVKSDTSRQKDPYHVFSSSGTYTVTMKTTDPAGCNYTVTRVISTPDIKEPCITYHAYSKLLTPYIDYSVVSITWKDDDGTLYSTNHVKQPTDSYFEIISIEDYLVNENSERTKKINALVKCTLSDGTKSISMDKVNVTFAISYK